MWIYEKKLEHPVVVQCADLKMAQYLLTQYGGPDGELSAAVRYLTQRYNVPTRRAKAVLTDIGTEELAHLEMIATMVYKLLDGVPPDQLEKAGLGAYYAVHDSAVFPADPTGNPWTASYIQAVGDPVADLHEDLAAEKKAEEAYERLIQLTGDESLKMGLNFLREREVVHFQRFGETLDYVQDYMVRRHVF